MNFFLVIGFVFYSLFSFQIETKQQPDKPKKDCRKDADDDGINDCFDQYPNTPQGVRVDSRGCLRDTDGDGVPDFKDKQMITPTECQPTDTNGIGECNKIKTIVE